MTDLPESARKVQDLLTQMGHGQPVVTFPETTRTAAEAATAIGCTVAQIAKSLVFKSDPGDRPVLVIASGTNRVDEARVADALSAQTGAVRIRRGDAAFVRSATGFAIGGVPPIGHATAPIVVIDRDLLGHAEIWAAAGTPNAVFALTPDQLVTMTGGKVASIAAQSSAV